MTPTKCLLFAIIALLAACGASGASHDRATPATPSAAQLVVKLADAHGGLASWQLAKSIRFRHLVSVPDDTPWISDEVHEPGIGGRSVLDWPVDGARIAFDGQRVWSTNWSRGNPPTMMAKFIYYFVTLPWLASDPAVELGEVAREKLPGDDVSYYALEMRFAPGEGKPPNAERYRLYIDPESYRLRAVDFWVSFGPLLDLMDLPADVAEIGPLRHIFTETESVAGLVVPTRFVTYGPDMVAYGHHTMTRWSLDRPFDGEDTAMPPGALLDDATPARGSSTFPWRARGSELEKARNAAHHLAAEVIAAHGGAKAWADAKSISYTHELSFPGADKPWVSREVVENSPAHRLYQDVLSHGGALSWDGREVWSVDWKLDNPPRIQPFLSLYSLITPFLALDPMVSLEVTEAARLPKDKTEYLTLTVKPVFDAQRPPTAAYYRIYIDPITHRMKGVAYNVVFGHMLDLMELPPEVTQMGPMIHVFDEMATVDGIVVPTSYWTQGPSGSVAGTHRVRDWSFRKPFDEARMVKPPNAVVDNSPHERAAAK